VSQFFLSGLMKESQSTLATALAAAGFSLRRHRLESRRRQSLAK
jgi:hypothetical protein